MSPFLADLHPPQLLSQVAQFDGLVSKLGGPRERQRWRRLLRLLHVVHVCPAAAHLSAESEATETGAAASPPSQPGDSCAASGRPGPADETGLADGVASRDILCDWEERQQHPNSNTSRSNWALSALSSVHSACSSVIAAPPQYPEASPGRPDGHSASQDESQATLAQAVEGQVQVAATRLAPLQWLTPQAKAVLAVSDEMQVRCHCPLCAPLLQSRCREDVYLSEPRLELTENCMVLVNVRQTPEFLGHIPDAGATSHGQRQGSSSSSPARCCDGSPCAPPYLAYGPLTDSRATLASHLRAT